MSESNLQLSGSLKLKSLAVRTGLGSLAMRFRRLLGIRQRLKHPELWELYLEEQRFDPVLKALLETDSCAADVGAHIGSFLDALMKLAPRGHHSAFEASPVKVKWLRSRFPEVNVFPFAVSNAAGKATFYEDVENSGYSSLISSGSPRKSVKQYEVETRTLDDLLSNQSRLDLIKLDIEGAELDAMKGAAGLIARFSPALIFECGTEYDRSRLGLFEFVTDVLGYEIFSFTDFLYNKGSLTFDEFRKFGLYPFRGFNFVALPRGRIASLKVGVPGFDRN